MNIYNSAEYFERDGVEYGVSIGRRQPMHQMHCDSIHEILNAGLKLFYIVGSTNTAFKKDGSVDRLFDPISNPLTFERQEYQLFSAFPELSDDEVEIIPFDDLGNLSLWSKNLCNLLSERGVLHKFVFHFRGKEVDRGEVRFVDGGQEVVLQNAWPTDALLHFGLNIWYSKNLKKEDYDIHSSELRTKPVDEHREEFATPDYIIKLINEARECNPNEAMIKELPLTMFDLSLDRLNKEAKITTSEIIKNASEVSISGLTQSANKLLKAL